MAVKNTYSADNITKLDFPQAIWKRTSMYLGARGTQMSVAIREIQDNAVHEAVRGFADKVRIVFNADESIVIQDNGRGLPTGINKKTGLNGIILTMATLHAGSNFTSNVDAGKAGAGINGVGAAACNAVSERFDVLVYQNDREYSLSFQDGFPGHFNGDSKESAFTPGDKVKSRKDPRSSEEKKRFPTGTRIQVWFNKDRFPADESLDIDDLIDRLKYTAYVVPGLDIEVIDKTRTHEDGSFYEWKFRSDNGIPEMVEAISPANHLPGTESKDNEFSKKGIYSISTQGTYSEVTSDEEGKSITVDRAVTADLAFSYNTGYEKNVISFVNTIHTHLGGVHEQALEKALTDAFGERLGSMRGILTAKDEPPITEDFFEGLTLALSVNVPEPQFVGQQKDKLSGPEVKKVLTKILTEELSKFAQSQKNQGILKPMFEKVAKAAKNRRALADARAVKRKSNQISASSMPAKLADCEITGEEESELLLCEGDSAAGTVKKARDATYQAVLPLRGKVLNCLTASNKEVLANAEIMDIAKALGTGLGKDFDVEKIRYGKVLICADSDVDGLHICNLIYTIFNRCFRPIIEEGRLYQTVPPLYEITPKKRGAKTLYAEDGAELKSVTDKLDSEGTEYRVEYNKGLGEMNPEAFFETVLDPTNRTLRRITLDDVEAAEEMLSLTMGKNSPEKKDLIGGNYHIAVESGFITD